MRGRATQDGLLRGSPSHASPESRSGDLPALSAFVAFEVFVEYAMKMAADDRDLVWILTSLCCKAGFSWIIFSRVVYGVASGEREREREDQIVVQLWQATTRRCSSRQRQSLRTNSKEAKER